MSLIDLFSRMIRNKCFDINFLEILAEENYKNIKSLLEKYYNGTDKNAAPPELKKKHVEILADYMEIIKEKYKVDENKIFSKLQEIEGENQEEQLSAFVNSLEKYEKIYYELFIQLILEQPNSESWIEAYATPIFKTIRNTLITLGGFKIASLTGSKLLAGLTASIGGAYTFKDVKEELVKTYFSLKEKERRIY
jgi:hypothetical protein